MRTISIITLMATVSVFAQTRGSSSSPPSDATFLKNAAGGGLAEVQLGQLAQKNGSADVVKQFGAKMVSDHTSMNEKVKALAASKNITLPAHPSAKGQATYRSLSAKTGSDFDKAYILDMIRDHTDDISEFQEEANSGKDPDIKALAVEALPTLQEHLRLAESAAKQLGIPTSSGPGLR